MKRDAKTYCKLFISTFTLSAFTFGGGYVIVPLMKKKFVDQLGWIEEHEMLDLIAIAQSAPGPIAVNTSILLGYRIGSWYGALLSILGTILPPLIILSVISLFYTAFRDNKIVAALLHGMQAGVAAVICDVVISMGTSIVRTKSILSILIMVTVFIATYLYHFNVIYTILLCAIIGIISYYIREKRSKDGAVS